MQRAWPLALLLAVSPLATAGLFSDDDAQKKIVVLQQETQQLQQKLTLQEERLAALDTALRSQGLVDLLQSVEALKTEIAKLRGQIEVNTNQIDTTQKRQKDLYVDLDNRLRKLERIEAPAGAAPPTGASVSPIAPTGTNTPPNTISDPAAENRMYDTAFNLFKIGNYLAAIGSFQNFQKTYPTSPLAANAQYWIGNAYSALKDYRASITQQQKLLSTYANSPKVPDAMLNIASSLLELSEKEEAKKTLMDIITKYPLSPAADNAKKRLVNLN